MTDGMQIAVGAGSVWVVLEIVKRLMDTVDKHIWKRNQKTDISGQTLNVEHVKESVSRDEFTQAVNRLDKTIETTFSRINDLVTKVSDTNAAISTQLGEMRGAFESDRRTNDAYIKLLHNIFDKMNGTKHDS